MAYFHNNIGGAVATATMTATAVLVVSNQIVRIDKTRCM